MERKCIFCEAQIDLKKHGLTKFCSSQCRNKYYYQNKSTKEMEDGVLGTTDEKLSNNDKEQTKSEEVINPDRKSNFAIQSNTRNNDSFIYSLIEEKFDAKNESNFYKLKCEQLEEEKRNLQTQIFELKNELENLDDEEEEPGIIGLLSNLPENIISGVSKAAFENEQIREIIKMVMTKSST